MFKNLIITSFLAAFISVGVYAKEPAVAHTSAEWQIWAYSTAAPDFIGDFATVKGANGEVLREGSNGWVCVAFNPMPEGGFNTPHDANPACGDAASLAWVDAYRIILSQKWKVMAGCGCYMAIQELITLELILRVIERDQILFTL